MDILNFISWIRGGRQVTTVDPAKTLLPVGLKDGRRDDEYLAGAITVEDLAAQIAPQPAYKVYTALLTQSGTDAPVATVLENTLGGEVVWSRVGVGIYSAILANAFTADNTIFPQGIEWTAGLGVVPLTKNTFFDHGYQIYRIDSNEINFATYDSSYVSKELSDISNSAKIFIENYICNLYTY